MQYTSKSITWSALPLQLLTADDCLVLTHLLWRPHWDRIAQQTAALDNYLQEVEKLRTLDLADVLSARLLRAQEGEQH